MSYFARLEMTLKDSNLSIEFVFDLLVNGCWLDEEQREMSVKEYSIESIKGIDEIPFKIMIFGGKLIIETDSPWDLELISNDLKEVAMRKEGLAEGAVEYT